MSLLSQSRETPKDVSASSSSQEPSSVDPYGQQLAIIQKYFDSDFVVDVFYSHGHNRRIPGFEQLDQTVNTSTKRLAVARHLREQHVLAPGGFETHIQMVYNDYRKTCTEEKSRNKLKEFRSQIVEESLEIQEALNNAAPPITLEVAIRDCWHHRFCVPAAQSSAASSIVKFYDPGSSAMKNSFRSFIAMSRNCSTKTIQRWVDPLRIHAVTATDIYESVHGCSSSMNDASKVHIVAGWSGSGKSTAATLPTASSALSPEKNAELFCVVFTPSDIFSDDSTFTADEITYQDFVELAGNKALRDDTAALLFVRGLVTATVLSPTTALEAIRLPSFDATIILETNSDAKNGTEKKARRTKLFDASVLYVLRENLGCYSDQSTSFYPSPSTWKNRQFRFVLDEAGDKPVLVRAFISIWRNTLQPFLAEVLGIPDKFLFLYIVGTGTESFNSEESDRLCARDYTISKIKSSSFFHRMIQQLQNDNGTSWFAKTLLDQLFNHLYIKNSAVPSDVVRRTPSSSIASFRFLQLVTDNARCATLALQYVQQLLDDPVIAQLPSKISESCPKGFVESFLLPWSFLIISRFINLNALADVDRPQDKIADALRIVMSTTHHDLSLSDVPLLSRYGLLMENTETNNLIDGFAPSSSSYRPRYVTSECFVSMFLILTGADRVDENENKSGSALSQEEAGFVAADVEKLSKLLL